MSWAVGNTWDRYKTRAQKTQTNQDGIKSPASDYVIITLPQRGAVFILNVAGRMCFRATDKLLCGSCCVVHLHLHSTLFLNAAENTLNLMLK